MPDAQSETVEIVLGEFLGRDEVKENGGGEVVECHPPRGHFVEEVFLLGSNEAVALAAEVDVEEADLVEDRLAIGGVAAAGIFAAWELPLTVAKVELAGDELSCEV